MGVGYPVKVGRREHVAVQPPEHDPVRGRELVLGDIQCLAPAVVPH
jgi:hypothetical protein